MHSMLDPIENDLFQFLGMTSRFPKIIGNEMLNYWRETFDVPVGPTGMVGCPSVRSHLRMDLVSIVPKCITDVLPDFVAQRLPSPPPSSVASAAHWPPCASAPSVHIRSSLEARSTPRSPRRM